MGLDEDAVPETMAAYVIRPERLGTPTVAMVLEQMEVPEPGPGEVLIRVVAAGVNYNGVWSSLGRPVSVFDLHGQPTHVPGSEASGVVVRCGPGVRRWRAGDAVVVNPSRTCGECPACNGADPLSCDRLKVYGYETTPGSFAEYTVVQSRQLLPKPAALSWEQAAGAGALYIAYRMLVTRAGLRPGQVVLVWGGAGGLGTMAIQLCRAAGAYAVAVVSSAEKAALCRDLGAAAVIDRREFTLDGGGRDQAREIRRFGAAIRGLTGGRDPDIVFEHVGAATFAASLVVCKRLGTVVTCGATTGYDLAVDARILWMRQKSILASHLSSLEYAEEASRVFADGSVVPVVSRVVAFDEVAEAHQMLMDNTHVGKLIARVTPAPADTGASAPAAAPG